MTFVKSPSFSILPGHAHPLGPSLNAEGVNFALFSAHATAVTLVLFFPNAQPINVPLQHKTGAVWHTTLSPLPPTVRYAYRVDGPFDPTRGLCFDPTCLLLDPYAPVLDAPTHWGEQRPYLNKIAPENFDWEGVRSPRRPLKDIILYEMHVRGFTKDPSSQTKHPGTFLGVIEKIPYLKQLGVNAIEFMPLHEFREWDCPFVHPQTQQRLFNYWGYASIHFFSPMRRYGSLEECKQMVKALHAAGIEVILDVVYNHTGEGSSSEETLCFKGLENKVYYMLSPEGEHLNYSGCGNTFNTNHPVTRALILASLRYWVEALHFDGFRFDLASILTRDEKGHVLKRPPILEEIAQDPVLADTKLIAEAWDAGGLYQVGLFPYYGRWAEWNGKYRDDVRRFIKGTGGAVGFFATRLCGSEDIYGNWGPYRSINIITTHDGFTLHDLVSYNSKHNEENGEHNRDGDNQPESWNCGQEGETPDTKVLMLRERQMRNFLLTLFLSQGVPMLVMGDEYGHSKRGNNNTWAHDHRINWFQWDKLEHNSALFDFCCYLIRLRKEIPLLRRTSFFRHEDIRFYNVNAHAADWGPEIRFLSYTISDPTYALYIAFNAYHTSLEIALPPPPHGPWKLLTDTGRSALPKAPKPLLSSTRRLLPHSALFLLSGTLTA